MYVDLLRDRAAVEVRRNGFFPAGREALREEIDHLGSRLHCMDDKPVPAAENEHDRLQ